MATPSTNETLIGIPHELRDLSAVRVFLIRLVEKLDAVLGYRGDAAYVSQSDIDAGTETVSVFLQGIISAVTAELSQSQSLAAENSRAYTDEQIATLKSSTSVIDLSLLLPTISDPPTQAEVQDIVSDLTEIQTQVNALLAELRSVEIIAT